MLGEDNVASHVDEVNRHCVSQRSVLRARIEDMRFLATSSCFSRGSSISVEGGGGREEEEEL